MSAATVWGRGHQLAGGAQDADPASILADGNKTEGSLYSETGHGSATTDL